MKIQIDSSGLLLLERKGQLRFVYCGLSGLICGDRCALFNSECDSVKAHISLCKKDYYCPIEDFTDERG